MRRGEAQAAVSTVARRRRGTRGEDEAVAPELEEVSIAWRGADGGEEERHGEARTATDKLYQQRF
jgi:hypothetical protein